MTTSTTTTSTTTTSTSTKEAKSKKVTKPTTKKTCVAPNAVPLEQFQQFILEIQAISSQTDTLEVAHIVKDYTSETLRCDRTSFYFVDGDFLDLVIAKGVESIRMPKTTGFAGMCATTNRVVNIADAYEDSRFNRKWDIINNYRTKQILCAPVFDETENEVIGVLQCINKKSDIPFDIIDRELIVCIAQQVAVAVRFAVQMEDAKQSMSQKEALISYIKNMNTNTNVASLLFTLNKAAQELLEADRCTFYTIDHAAQSMHLINSDSEIDITLKLTTGIAGSVGSTGKNVNIPDCYKDKRFDPSFDRMTGYHTRSMLVMPIFADVNSNRHKEKPIAVVQLINKKKGETEFDVDDEEILHMLLRFVGPLIKNSHLFTSRKRKREYDATRNLKLHEISRMPSHEFKDGMRTIMDNETESEADVDVEEEEEERPTSSSATAEVDDYKNQNQN